MTFYRITQRLYPDGGVFNGGIGEDIVRPREPWISIEIPAERKHDIDKLTHVPLGHHVVHSSRGNSRSDAVPNAIFTKALADFGKEMAQVSFHTVLEIG